MIRLFCGVLPHAPQESTAPLNPVWAKRSSFFTPTTLSLVWARTRGFVHRPLLSGENFVVCVAQQHNAHQRPSKRAFQGFDL